MPTDTNAMLSFPPGFLWGTATSAHQVEGNNTNNQWWLFEQQPGKIWNGDRSGLACDWWQNAEHDFDLMQEMGLNTHRLSLEWSRIEPEPGHFSHAAIDRYREMLDGLRRRGIKPMVTLHHFTNPLWLERQGGWERPEVVTRFQHYARYTVKALADLCDTWLTLNEPLVYLAQSWFRGIWPPERPGSLLALPVYRHLLLAHGAGYQAIHACQPEAQVGVAMAIRLFTPSTPSSRLDRIAAAIKRYVGEGVWLQAVHDGRIRPPLGLGEYNRNLAGSMDFIGINYYTRDLVRFTPDPRRLFGVEHFRSEGEFSDRGWRGIYSELVPEGLRQIIEEVGIYHKPIYVTENGLPDRDDDQRPRWLLAHLAEVHKAVRNGCDVRGYYHWTFADNFEWSEGWGLRFGLIELDPETQVRIPRPSARLFADLARSNGIRRATATQYAPELLPRLFPGEATSAATGALER